MQPVKLSNRWPREYSEKEIQEAELTLAAKMRTMNNCIKAHIADCMECEYRKNKQQS